MANKKLKSLDEHNSTANVFHSAWNQNAPRPNGIACPKLEDEMNRDTRLSKLRRWVRLQQWLLICSTRKFWDKTYSNYIFKKK